MSVAERTREAVRAEPFLLDALGAGVVNYSAAARYLDVDGDEESVATALRRFAEELESPSAPSTRASVRLHRGVAVGDDPPDGGGPGGAEGADPSESLLSVGDRLVVDGGSLSALEARGELAVASLERVLGRLRAGGVDVEAAGAATDGLVVVVPQRAGADALRIVEGAL